MSRLTGTVELSLTRIKYHLTTDELARFSGLAVCVWRAAGSDVRVFASLTEPAQDIYVAARKLRNLSAELEDLFLRISGRV